MWTQNDLKEHAVYQIWPASFCDGNKDGLGDLKGIISKLDYLKELGIHLVWLSPIYQSPMVDMGYDISDYKSINPRFGTMEDFETLIEEAKKRDIRIIMDLVVNHTSDQHPWFQEALKNPNSKYRDYYIFRKGKGDNQYPNNWTSTFTGSAWEKVPNEENMYYLHIFTKQQPDLNWKNPEVLNEVESILNFWLDKGVYGFRCDVISSIYKTSLEDGKKRKEFKPIGVEHYVSQPGMHEILKKLRKDCIDPHQGILIGEGSEVTLADAPKYLDSELDSLFEFDIANPSHTIFKLKTKPEDFKKVIVAWQKGFDGNGNYLENHDQHRSIGKYVYGKEEERGAKMLLTLLYTLKGTPFIYMGEEFGTRDYEPHLKLEETHDVVTKEIMKICKKYHLPKWLAYKVARHSARDDCRAPIAFDGSKGHGFTSDDVKPWQKFNPLSDTINMEAEKKNPNSILSYFKKINALKETEPILSYGNITILDTRKDVLSYIREYQGKKIQVVLNLSSHGRKGDTPKGKLLLSNVDVHQEGKLLPYEADVYQLD